MLLAQLIRKWRLMAEVSIVDVAAEIGIPAPSLAKFEREGTISGENLGKVLTWSMLPAQTTPKIASVEDFIGGT